MFLMLEIKGMKFPLDRKYYTKNGAHLWLKSEGEFIKIGMDAFAAEMMGLFTVINVDKKQVKQGEAIGSFESAKFISKLYSPISGKIIDVNDKILRNPFEINKKPYKSWIFKMKSKDNAENKYIMRDKDKILKWISKELEKVECNV